MVLSVRLDLRQTQSLVMTPQLQQAIKLLQLSNLELSAYVDQELERNPLLQRDEDGDGGEEESPSADPPEDRAAAEGEERLLDSLSDPAEPPLDIDYDNTFTSDAPEGETAWDGNSLFDWSGQSKRTDFSDPENALEQTVPERLSLRDHLTVQLGLEVNGPVDRLIGADLIEMLDDAGYLGGSLEEVAGHLGCDRAQVEAVLYRMQKFDPPGIFARTLKECLAIQLQERNRLDPAMQILLDNLDMLARRNFAALMHRCGVDAEDLAEMMAEIRALTPKPAFSFDATPASPILPDVLMRAAPEGGWLVELNAETLPRLLVDTRYYAKIIRTVRSKEDKTYLSENLQAANWLVKSLHQRATTILKVVSEIVRQQNVFFLRGVEHLHPLVLRDIAQAIEMHESTVSRVTSNKYIATPRGIFELKYFFTQAINAADGGDAYSAEVVRHRIKTLIDAELPERILSDDVVVGILRAEGIEIARRTVAKYREALHIPSSVQRRRDKGLCLLSAASLAVEGGGP
ncbi:MAG: RNA polymerase sigma-54 factor [Rhodospirillaceae bacterium]|nr:MAG: RNA polymerase sigma-54 factor [Rhodospirillaceae bacterium]